MRFDESKTNIFGETIVNVIFDAGKGSSPVASREGTSGQPFGELPRPVRSGYSFEGWYLGEVRITAESILRADEDVRLVARWEKKEKDGKRGGSVMFRQKVMAVCLAVAIVFLAVALAVANRLVAVYHLTDRYYDENNVEQSERYTIKRQNGVYKLFNKKGDLMETTENGYTSASDGIRYEVYVAETSGNQYLINTSTGDYETYAIVDYDENLGESLGGTVKNKRVMMFPRIGQDNTFSVEVKNQYGSFKFYRETVENTKENATTKYTTQVHIAGTENSLTTYDPTLFASLCVSCGYTLTMQKLNLSDPAAPRKADGSIDLDAYGLEDRYDEEGNLVYSPAVYTIVKAQYAADGACSATDTSYTVKVGDAILSGAGYYVMLEGRNAVYITSSEIGKTVLQPVESLVTPATIYPMTVSTYVMVYNFILGTLDSLDIPEGEEGGEDHVKLVAAFDFVDLAKRENTIYSSVPYWLTADLNIMTGYQFNNDSVSTVLGNLYGMEYVSCKKLNPVQDKEKGIDDFEEYHLNNDVYWLSFRYDPEVANGGSDKENWVDNILIISQKTENGTYFVYSYLYDMIVEVDQYYLSFLEWEQNRWYNQYFFQHNISYIKDLSITSGDKTYNFEMDNRFSYAFYDNGDGTGTVIDLTKGTIAQRSDGSYVYTVTKTAKEYTVYFMDFSADRTYRDSKTNKIMYRSESGVVVEVNLSTTNLNVYCPQYNGPDGSHLLDYTIEETTITDKGTTKTQTYTALDNFRRLYSKLLWYSIEGDVSEKELGSSVEDYIKTHQSTTEIRFSIEDMAAIMNPENYGDKGNNKMNLVIRLYQYTERKCLLTIEVLDPNNPSPDPAKGQGNFYVLASEMDNILQYAEDLLNQKLLPSST